MIKTRNSVFETNSSSTHSVSIEDITDKDMLDTMLPNEDGNIVLEGGEFGWEEESYNDAWTKANYLAVYSCLYSGDLDETFKENLKNVIKDQTKCKNVIFEITDDWNKNYSYIDHQSVECRDYDDLMRNLKEIRNFIFNKKSYLYTDNDNH